MFQDEEYYMTLIYLPGGLKGRKKDILYWWMAQFVCDRDISIVGNSRIELTANDYRSLRPRSYISNCVVDCYAVAKLGSFNWNNAIYIATYETLQMIGDNYNLEKGKNWCMYQINQDFQGIVLLPYVYKHHWMLIVLDVAKGSLKHIDPLTSHSPDRDRAVKALKDYFNDCKTNDRLTYNLCNSEWEIVDDDEERPIQKD